MAKKSLFTASNFRKIKRVLDVIKIFAQIKKAVPSKLLMIGDGPERTGCEELARQLGVHDEVRFLGKQEQMEEIMAVADLFLLPSEYESFGLSALEAMAAHVPVISSDAGGLPEVNINGVTGFLAPVGDIDTMSRCAIDLLKNEEQLSQFKQNAFEQASRFDIHNIVPEYEKLYSRFCEMGDCK